MNLENISDAQLLINAKSLVARERELLSDILRHLHEIDRRKLYSDLKCHSLHDYCVSELKYTSAQAYRRIAAMRLLKTLPENNLMAEIRSGDLSLSNIASAARVFREIRKITHKSVAPDEKLRVLRGLQNTSSRNAEKSLAELARDYGVGSVELFRDASMEIKLDSDLRSKMEEVRALLGERGTEISTSELIKTMADLAIDALMGKKFGKRRVEKNDEIRTTCFPEMSKKNAQCFEPQEVTHPKGKFVAQKKHPSRTISQSVKYRVWRRDQGSCTKCGSRSRLNLDHIKPFALGGKNTPENLRILCSNCNQRERVNIFGVKAYGAERSGQIY